MSGYPLPDETRLNPAERRAFGASVELVHALAALRPVHPDEMAEAVVQVHALQKSILARACYPEHLR